MQKDPAVREVVESGTLDDVLEGYEKKGTRYVDSVTYLGQGRAEGQFTVHGHYHFDTEDQLYHLTEADVVVLFNQFGYAVMAHLLRTGRIPQVDLATFTNFKDDFRDIELRSSPIRSSGYDYPRGIDLAADPTFPGKLYIKQLSYLQRPDDVSLHTEMVLDLADGAIHGERDWRFYLK